MSAAASRRQLHTVLHRLRVDAGLTQTAVAEAHEWSPSKVHRIEKGTVSIGKPDLLALLAHYGVTDPTERDRLVELARESRNRAMPFASYRDVFSPEIIRVFGYEASASSIRELASLVVPGLLQTPEYTRALIRGGQGMDDTSAQKFVKSRRERQQLLDRPDPPSLTFLLDESVLMRAIGGRATIEAQLLHLLEMAKRPHVIIQVLPFSLGAHEGLRGSFTYLQFEEKDDPDVVYMENRRGDSIFENDDEVTSNALTQFCDLAKLAPPPGDLQMYVDRALDRL